MIVAMSRRIAANLYKEIIALRPEWHDDDLSKGAIKVVMTSTSADGLKCNATTRQNNSVKV
jgi:type I restriction enzyme R subunit